MVVVIGLLTAIPGAPLQDPVTGRVIGDSPFMDSLIVIIALIFFAAGLAYGRGAGTINGKRRGAGVDHQVLGRAGEPAVPVPADRAVHRVLQLLQHGRRSPPCSSATCSSELDIGAVWLLIGFIIVTMVVDLIMPAAIAKWAILAPIFIPLLIRLDVTPQTVLAAYRVGDSPLNVVTPLMAYFPLIVVFVKRYQKRRGDRDGGLADAAVRDHPVGRLDAVLRRLVPARHPARAGLARPSLAPSSMDDSTITFVVLGAVGRAVRLGPAAGGDRGRSASRSALWATGVLSLEDALAGFGDPTVLFIASLFVVSEALDASGVTAWVGQELVARVGESRTRLIVYTMALVALLTALINVNGAVAALVPVAVVMAVRTGRSPSQLLLPLAFGAHAGSLLALTGTPVNVIVSDAAADAGVGASASSSSRWSGCR